MNLIDQAVVGNREYAKSPAPLLRERPKPRLAVVTCMDPRLSDLPAILGLPHSDLDVIRTAGPSVTDDVIAELIASNRVIGTTEIMVINHTGCGFSTFTSDQLNRSLVTDTGDASPEPMNFFTFDDPVSHTRDQLGKIRNHPWIADTVPIRGFVLDMDTGLLCEVDPMPERPL